MRTTASPLLIACGLCAAFLFSGCGQKGPTSEEVRMAVEDNLPPVMSVEDVEFDFISGGLDQGVVRIDVKVSLKDDFFETADVSTDLSEDALPHSENALDLREKAKQAGVRIPDDLESAVSAARQSVSTAKSSFDVPVIRRTHSKGEMFDIPMKGRVVRDGKTWSILRLSSEGPQIEGQPRNTFPTDALIEGDPAIQEATLRYKAAQNEYTEAQNKFADAIRQALDEKAAVIAKEAALREKTLKKVCTEKPLYGLWSTEHGRGEIGIEFTRFEVLNRDHILVEGAFFFPADASQRKLFVGKISGDGFLESPYIFRLNVYPGNGVIGNEKEAYNTTIGLLLDKCEYSVDLAFDRDFKRLNGKVARGTAKQTAINTGYGFSDIELIFSSDFMPNTKSGDSAGNSSRHVQNPLVGAKPLEAVEHLVPSKTMDIQPLIKPITEAQISAMSPQGIQDAINELYARHGLTFKDTNIQSRFSKESWYRPQADLSHEQVEALFSETALANRKILVAARESRSRSSPPRFTEEETNLLIMDSFSTYFRFQQAINKRNRAEAESVLQAMKANYPESPHIYSAEMFLAAASKDAKGLERAYVILNERYTFDETMRSLKEENYKFLRELVRTTSSRPVF
jgi:hypothetical protein